MIRDVFGPQRTSPHGQESRAQIGTGQCDQEKTRIKHRQTEDDYLQCSELEGVDPNGKNLMLVQILFSQINNPSLGDLLKFNQTLIINQSSSEGNMHK